MATIDGNLWHYNFVHVIVVDVSDDYELAQDPLPSDFYPVLKEAWVPRYGLDKKLPSDPLVQGYLYDWHEDAKSEGEPWYVGVVSQELAERLIAEASA